MQLVILRGLPAQTYPLAPGEGIIGRTPEFDDRVAGSAGFTAALPLHLGRANADHRGSGQRARHLGQWRADRQARPSCKLGDEIVIGEVVLQPQSAQVPPPIPTSCAAARHCPGQAGTRRDDACARRARGSHRHHRRAHDGPRRRVRGRPQRQLRLPQTRPAASAAQWRLCGHRPAKRGRFLHQRPSL